jgi:hypothetical protein
MIQSDLSNYKMPNQKTQSLKNFKHFLNSLFKFYKVKYLCMMIILTITLTVTKLKLFNKM